MSNLLFLCRAWVLTNFPCCAKKVPLAAIKIEAFSAPAAFVASHALLTFLLTPFLSNLSFPTWVASA
jgi:hypothetical protein